MKSNLDTFKAAADELLKKNAAFRQNGAVASHRTQEITREVVMAMAERLAGLNQCPERPQNLKTIHIKKLFESWIKDDLAAKTIQNNVSRLRQFCVWAGRPELFPKNAHDHYAKDVPKSRFKVTTVAKVSKSWSEHGINVPEKLLEADKIDRRFGAMLRLGLAFGLRRKEQLRCKPNKLEVKGNVLIHENIAKSGKQRIIPIEHPFQRVALEYAKRLVGRDEHLGWPNQDYRANYHAYSYKMKLLGITGKDTDCVGHGLRAEYAENIAMLHGLLPPVLGGKCSQMEKDARLSIQRMVSENMGHHRPEVTGAYYGSFRGTVLNAPLVKQSAIPEDIANAADDDCVQIGRHLARLSKDEASKLVTATLISLPIPISFTGPTIESIVNKIHRWEG